VSTSGSDAAHVLALRGRVEEVGRADRQTPSVQRLRRCDLERALEFVYETAAGPAAGEPFAPPVLGLLGQLLGADFAVYSEWDLHARRYPRLWVDTPRVSTAADVAEATYRLCPTYPLSVLRLSGASKPCVLSDFVSSRRLHRLEYYHHVLRPMGVEHQLRLWLPAPAAASRVFYFNRSSTGGDFADRERGLLELLRPFLVALRERFALHENDDGHTLDCLTGREAEILQLVARGKTNHEIAALLVVSDHTVRKHLEHVYEKLDVHTRTAAAAAFLGGRPA
jgi:DNA-binding CsgD family transcriptional regulator